MVKTIEINGQTYEIKPYANLCGANLRGANLYGADLYGANLRDADLYGADLRGANLYDANLYGADLYGANLRDANLCGADLYGANLCGADLYGADLCGANLYGADLYGANLYGADLRGANLRGANLCGANLYGANLCGAKNPEGVTRAQLSILPDEGDVIGWKRAYSPSRSADGKAVIVKLRIPSEAKRSNATGRKCRAECAEVLEIIGADEAVSSWDSSFTYRPGETVRPTQPFDDDPFYECASGIHFFITRAEAEAY